MNTLQAIADKLDTERFIKTITQHELEAETYEDLSFAVTDQLNTDGYIAITAFYGRDYETNAHLHEHEWTARTVTEAVRILNGALDSYASRYAD